MLQEHSKYSTSEISDRIMTYLPILIGAILFRLLITTIKPYAIDMGGYVAWSSYLAENGPKEFYTNSGFHVVYAPFYMYFLWFTGKLVQLFSLPAWLHVYLIKCWSVVFEFLGSILIIKLSEKYNLQKQGFLLASLYAVNPGVFMNSSVWGQFDSIPATMLLGVLLLFEYKKNNLAALLFLLAVLTKPQSGLLLPIVMYLYFRNFKFDVANVKKLLTGLISGILLYLAVVLPFYSPTSKSGTIPGFLDWFYWLFDLYSKSIQDYPFATANAFNFWFLFGGQIQNDTFPFLGLNYFWWGNILLIIAVAFAFTCLIKGRATMHSVCYFSYLVQFSAFMFMTKMHERYLLPAIIFIMASAIFDKRHISAAGLVSVWVFANQLYLYKLSFYNIYWLNRWDATALVFSLLTTLTYTLSLYNGYRIFIARDRKIN